MLAMDSATGKLWYGVNDSWYNSGDPAAGTNQASTAPATEMPMGFKLSSNGSTSMASTINFGQDSSFAGAKTAQGNTDGMASAIFIILRLLGSLHFVLLICRLRVLESQEDIIIPLFILVQVLN